MGQESHGILYAARVLLRVWGAGQGKYSRQVAVVVVVVVVVTHRARQ